MIELCLFSLVVEHSVNIMVGLLHHTFHPCTKHLSLIRTKGLSTCYTVMKTAWDHKLRLASKVSTFLQARLASNKSIPSTGNLS